jgi:hypothetical protein
MNIKMAGGSLSWLPIRNAADRAICEISLGCESLLPAAGPRPSLPRPAIAAR